MSERFIPPTEEEVRKSLYDEFKRRASEACYWKEHFEDTNYPESAELQRTIESIWNTAADIAMRGRT